MAFLALAPFLGAENANEFIGGRLEGSGQLGAGARDRTRFIAASAAR